MLDIFWRRAERWRDTPFSADARAPWISYLAYCYELVVRAGDRLGDDKLLSAQLRRLRGRLRLVFQTRVEWRLKIKVMLATLGWTWPQRLSLKLHGVST